MNLPTKPIVYTIFLLMLTLLGLIVFSDNGLMELNRLRMERSQITEKNLRLSLNNRRLHRIIQRLKNDSAYIEYTARRELGMVGTRQIIFKLTGTRNDTRRVEPPRKQDE